MLKLLVTFSKKCVGTNVGRYTALYLNLGIISQYPPELDEMEQIATVHGQVLVENGACTEPVM